MSCGMHPPDGPPVCTAFMLRPFSAPPPTSYTNVFSGVPMGISTSPVRCTLPTSENTFVPGLFGDPVSANQAGPRSTIGAILYQVSTLLMLVGLPNKPRWAGYGGRGLGRPALPSKE